MQWKIALSWISGYLAYQLFTPLLFRYQNPAVAGQMGITIYFSNIILYTGMIWLTTKFPLYGAMIKKNNYELLEKSIKKHNLFFCFYNGILGMRFSTYLLYKDVLSAYRG